MYTYLMNQTLAFLKINTINCTFIANNFTGLSSGLLNLYVCWESFFCLIFLNPKKGENDNSLIASIN